MNSINKSLLFCGALLVFIGMQSCGVNSNLMFKQAKGDVNYDSIPLRPSEVYKISPDDRISFTISTNNGSQIIENMSGISQDMNRNKQRIDYLVRMNGEVELPVIGAIVVEGLTVEECEDTLASLYGVEYQDPFVQVSITNQRVIVFPGDGSDAKVVPLTHSNTTLMEALALAGGITDRGKANTVKLIRKEGEDRQVYGIDLSTIDGLMYVDMVVQANDFIYVEPTAEIAKEISQDIVPVISILSSALFIYSAINVLK